MAQSKHKCVIEPADGASVPPVSSCPGFPAEGPVPLLLCLSLQLQPLFLKTIIMHLIKSHSIQNNELCKYQHF